MKRTFMQQRQGACPDRDDRRHSGISSRAAGPVLAVILAAGMLAGCGSTSSTSSASDAADTAASAAASVSTEAIEADPASGAASEAGSAAASEAGSTSSDAAVEAAADETAAGSSAENGEGADASEGAEASSGWVAVDTSIYDYDGSVIRVGSLKGPTTMGIVNLMKASDDGESAGQYTFDMESDPSAIVASVASGDLDIAMVPANLGATLYNKTNGGVEIIDINTLGVLYCVTADDSIGSIADFEGKTVLTTGQGATPEYVLNYLLSENNVTDCTLEFHSEATEIAALLKEDPEQIAVLPQPFVTVAEAQNDQLKTAFSLTDEWDKVAENGSKLITGATIVRTAFLQENPDAVRIFLAEHAESAELAQTDVDGTAQLVADYGIIEKAPVAKKALPQCGIVCTTGDEMKTELSGYLQVLYDADPASVGGTLPGDDFYCTFQAD